MTDESRDELRELREFCNQHHKPSIGSTSYINAELTPCSDEEFQEGLREAGWQQAGYISVLGGRVYDVAPDGTRTEIPPTA